MMPFAKVGKLTMRFACSSLMLPELSITKRKSTAWQPGSFTIGASGMMPMSNTNVGSTSVVELVLASPVSGCGVPVEELSAGGVPVVLSLPLDSTGAVVADEPVDSPVPDGEDPPHAKIPSD